MPRERWHDSRAKPCPPLRIGVRSPLNPTRDGLRETRIAIRTGGDPERFPSYFGPSLAQLDSDFFEGLEAIRDEGRAEYRQSLDAPRRQFRKH